VKRPGLAIAACTLLVGCISQLPVHGSFCGPGWPRTLPAAEFAALEPIDDVDAVCKAHDACYIERGYFEEECDEALIDALAPWGTRVRLGVHRNRCTNLADAIGQYFSHFHPSVGRGEERGLGSQLLLRVASIPLGLGTLLSQALMVPVELLGSVVSFAFTLRWDFAGPVLPREDDRCLANEAGRLAVVRVE
jgi:hypothetical protein